MNLRVLIAGDHLVELPAIVAVRNDAVMAIKLSNTAGQLVEADASDDDVGGEALTEGQLVIDEDEMKRVLQIGHGEIFTIAKMHLARIVVVFVEHKNLL